MKLKDKVAIITGGNSGIGFGIAEAFKNEGAKGAITGRNKDTLENSVRQLGTDFIGLAADVTDNEHLATMFKDAFEKFGKIDALVVNAGGAIAGTPMPTIDQASEAGYDEYMDLNLRSVYFTVQKALPYMKDGSAIVLIGSSAAHRAAPGMAIYSAAKAAVISLAKGLSLDLLERKIRVNVLSPGTIDTPAFDKLAPEGYVDQVKQAWVNLIPVDRIGLPADIGKAAVFLASDESSFILGTELLVDGGMTNISLMK
ncbi:SDR family NAD(P)-dependent oxidoreductase [Dyadobacter sp. CY326]|uniref:SDR family NAD(P)-dependent oxidoreductase n=1 Tax=Dyadobacter sp. CY326 TaxID=2907300 RepID=UPI001F39A44F|nr:glucose 1-dehydrogenase [Dyadobacter sp. CY326]MCE7065084.1 glucose 1-dehydrogenase [Dyadobacter sp. CY326]